MPTELSWAAGDSLALIGRSVRHSLRSIDALLTALMLPVLILLLFVYVFGGAISTGGDYVDYVVPGIILLCAGFGSAGTAVSVCEDMTSGMVDRIRSMPIRASALLTGHVTASVARNLASTAVVLAIALIIGFQPTSDPLRWLGVLGLLVLFMAAISWLSTVFGLLARSVEAANATGFVVMFLPYLSSAFVPPETMPGALQWIAEHQPITPITETLRGLLMETPVGSDAWTAVAWCVGGIVIGRVASARLFRRRAAG